VHPQRDLDWEQEVLVLEKALVLVVEVL